MEDILSNFIPVSRKIFNHPFWKEKRSFSKLEAWLDLIASARFEGSETTELIDGKMISWTRGQLPASLRYLAERWLWSRTKVNNFIRLLENEQMVERLTVDGYSVLSIKNYESYNGRQQREQSRRPQYNDVAEGENSSKNKRKTVERHASDKTNKENKENKEKDNLCVHSDEAKAKFKKFEEWILRNTPRVAMMRRPFTIGQHIALIATLQKDQVTDLLYAMENYLPLLDTNVSAYLTITRWAKKDKNRQKTEKNATDNKEEYHREREVRTKQVRKRTEN